MPKNIAVLVSGKGSNAKNIHRYFREKYGYGIHTLVSSRPNPELNQWAEEQNIDYLEIDKNLETQGRKVWTLPALREADLVVLAGFLRKIPVPMLETLDSPIVNIHPSLLPKYGGKGMYGAHVHEAVLAADEEESGITIHLVDREYDQGQILRQVSIRLSPKETVYSLQPKIHALEYEHYPQVIEALLYPSAD